MSAVRKPFSNLSRSQRIAMGLGTVVTGALLAAHGISQAADHQSRANRSGVSALAGSDHDTGQFVDSNRPSLDAIESALAAPEADQDPASSDTTSFDTLLTNSDDTKAAPPDTISFPIPQPLDPKPGCMLGHHTTSPDGTTVAVCMVPWPKSATLRHPSYDGGKPPSVTPPSADVDQPSVEQNRDGSVVVHNGSVTVTPAHYEPGEPGTYRPGDVTVE